MDQILIIKLGAMGDVLRTTPLLREIPERYYVTWVTDKESVEMLGYVKRIDKIVAFDYDTTFQELKNNKYDWIFCFDEDQRAMNLMLTLDADHKISWDKWWLQMSIDNKTKKQNMHSYQYWMFKSAGMDWHGQEYVLDWPVKVKRNVQKFVGLEMRVGEKWPTKNWKKWKELEKALIKEGYRVVKFSQKNFWEYVQDINFCDIVVTPDTLTMHIALALKKKVVALFTSTSSPEIYDYGRMVKVPAPIDCQGCYKRKCQKHAVGCSNSLKVSEVLNGIELLKEEPDEFIGGIRNSCLDWDSI